MSAYDWIGVVVLIGIVVLLLSCSPVMEGMTASATEDSSSSGEGGGAASFAATVGSAATKLQDSMLIPKYRKDYDAAILAVDDYRDALMLQTVLSISTAKGAIDADAFVSGLERLNTLQAAKSALNDVMKFVNAAK
jgi:hypothetical protein